MNSNSNSKQSRNSQVLDEINRCQTEIENLQSHIRKLKNIDLPLKVHNYTFILPKGEGLSLREAFRGNEFLFVIHNMGINCNYCTLWADEFAGVYSYLVQRASVLLTSPSRPEDLIKFAKKKLWPFQVASVKGSAFPKEMGMVREGNVFIPGVSVFQKKYGEIYRVGWDTFYPGDKYCCVWNLFDLLPTNLNSNWHP